MDERKVLVERAFETGEAQTQEYAINMPTGGRRFAETRIVPSGEDEFVMIVRDVTEERLTESRSHALLEAIPDTMFRLTREGVYLDFHTRTPEVLALPADTIIGTSIYDIPAHRSRPRSSASAWRSPSGRSRPARSRRRSTRSVRRTAR